MPEVRPSICRLCTAHCPILVTLADGRALRVVGDPEAPLFGAYTCPKGRALPELHASPERLLTSLARRRDGAHEPIASDKVVTEIARRVSEVVERHGPRSVALYIGTHSLPYPASGGMAAAFLRALGSKMIFSAATIDQPGKPVAAALHGLWQGGRQAFGGADTWLFVGTNPVVSKAGIAQNPGRQLVDAVARGMRLVVVDPRRSETARLAHVHLQARPGEDPTVLAGLLHVLLDEGLVDGAFARENLTGLAELTRAVAPFTPDYVARRAGVPREDLLEAARTLGRARRGGTAGGTGTSFATRGTLSFYLLLCIQSVRGFWGREGDPLQKPNVLLPGYEGRAQAYPPFPAWGYGGRLRVRGLANSVAGLPTAGLAEEILLEGEGRIRALFCLGGNPLMAWPDQARTRRALEALSLLVTTDVELSATSRLADYVVATRMSLETPCMTQQAEGLKYFSPGLGFDEPFAQYTPALVEPPPGSDLLEDWQLFYRLARELDLELQWVNFFGLGRHMESPPRVFPLDMEREPVTDELLELMCRDSRVPLAEVKRHPHGRVFDEARQRIGPREPDSPHRLDVGSAEMMEELRAIRSEDFEARRRDEARERPFLLVPRRENKVINSTGRSLPKLVGTRPYNPAFLHPDDLERLGLARGDLAEIRSAHGAVVAVVESERALRPGVVSMTHGFGAAPGEEEDPRRVGANTGRLLRCDAEFDPVTGIPRMGAVPVAVRAVPEPAAPQG